MVAAISGSGLGLYNTSATNLNGQGAEGTAAQGRTGEQVYVNTATGNLVLQDSDEVLAAEGLNIGIVRTYNSQGSFNGGVGQNWRLGADEALSGLTGTANTAGSTITKTFGDGAQVTYTYDAAQGVYTSSAGPSADDTVSYNASTQQWTWTDSASRTTEVYDSTGRLLSSSDSSGNTVTYGYNGSLLTQITDASGQVTTFSYSGGNITQISTQSNGVTQTLVYYSYDSLGRLSQVTVDLSPQDNSISDGNTYVTTYAYQGNTDLVSSITQSDGTKISFTYEQVNGEYLLQSYTDGLGNTTTLTYSSSGASAVTVNANSNALQSSQSQSGSGTATLNGSSLGSTAAQSQTNTATLDSSGLSTTEVENQGGSASLNQGALSTTETQTQNDTASLNSTALSSTAVQTQSATATLDGASVTSTQTDSTNSSATLNSGSLSTSQTGTASLTASDYPVLLDGLVTSTSGTQVTDQTGSLDTAGLSPTETQTDTTIANLNSSQLSTTETTTQSESASLDSGALSTTETETENESASLNSAALSTTATESTTTNYALNTSATSTTQTTTITSTANLNTGALTTPPNGWSGASALATPGAAGSTPEIAYDAAGNAFALWRTGSALYVERYNATSGTWGSALQLSASGGLRAPTLDSESLSADSAGNALVGWIITTSNGVVGESITTAYVAQYSAASGTWSAATSLGATQKGIGLNPSTSPVGSMVTAIHGSHATAAWVELVGTVNRIYASQTASSGWSTAAAIDANNGNAAAQPAVAIDASGNVSVLWQQSNGTAASIYSNRFNATAGTWSGATQLSTAGSRTAAANPQLAVDGQGNAFAIWDQGTSLYASRYSVSGGAWSTPAVLSVGTGAVSTTSLSVDSAGDALAAWIQVNGKSSEVYASRYSATGGAWGTAAAVETSGTLDTTQGNVVTAINGSNAAVAWLQGTGSNDTLHGVTSSGSAWGSPTLLSPSSGHPATEPSIAINTAGNIDLLWAQETSSSQYVIYLHQWGALLHRSGNGHLGFDCADALWHEHCGERAADRARQPDAHRRAAPRELSRVAELYDHHYDHRSPVLHRSVGGHVELDRADPLWHEQRRQRARDRPWKSSAHYG